MKPSHILRTATTIALVFLALLIPSIATADLTGEWEGIYRYSNQDSKPVRFQLDLKDRHGRLTGHTSEHNTFGDPSAPFLHANIMGSVEDDRVYFKKTYDGTGGQHHSIKYEGALYEDISTIKGAWECCNGLYGTFDMQLKNGQ